MMAWRFRQCPACREVVPAGDLVAVGGGVPWTDGRMLRTCPLCQHEGETREFEVVYETEAALAPLKLPALPKFECRVCGREMASIRVRDVCGGLRPCGLVAPRAGTGGDAR